MTPLENRIFIFLDEWLWIALCVYMLHRWSIGLRRPDYGTSEAAIWKRAFIATVIVGAVLVYGISYPMSWGWL